MAHEVPARLTPAEGRRFGLTVGGVFLALGAVSWWRGHDLAPVVLAAVGGALVVAGVAIPAALGPVFRGWMAVGLLLSRVTTPLFMGALYFLAIMPMGLVMRAFGRSPLRGRGKGASYWTRHESASGHSMTRQY